jgi:hypothetical protein
MRYIVKPYYRICPGLDVFVEYEYERPYGAFKTLQALRSAAAGDEAQDKQHKVTVGIGVIF